MAAICLYVAEIDSLATNVHCIIWYKMSLVNFLPDDVRHFFHLAQRNFKEAKTPFELIASM